MRSSRTATGSGVIVRVVALEKGNTGESEGEEGMRGEEEEA
jgi:hypothetical protein